MSTKSLVTMVWGDYWKKYGQKFIESAKSLNTQPDEILIVSDKQIDTPKNFKVIVLDAPEQGHKINFYRQKTYEYCETDWLCPLDIDDQILPNYLDDIKDEYDVINFKYGGPGLGVDHLNMWHDEKMYNCIFDEEIYIVNTFKDMGFAYPGISPCAFLNKSVYKKIKIPIYGLDDFICVYNLKLLGAKVLFDNTIRYNYFDVPNSVGKGWAKKVEETKKIYNELKEKFLNRQ